MGSTFSKGSEQSGQATGNSNALADLSLQLMNRGMNTSQPFLSSLQRFGKNGAIPRSLSLTGPLQDLAHQQATANQGLLDTGARGGQLNSALANNILQGQMGRQSMLSNLQQSLFSQGLNGGMGATSAGMGGSAAASGLLSNLGAQRIGQNQAFQQGLGQLGGMAGKAFIPMA